MTLAELNYENGTAHCPIGGCGWSVPEGREMYYADHKEEHHNG